MGVRPDEFKALRESLQLTHEEVARITGVESAWVVQRWEKPEGHTSARRPSPIAWQLLSLLSRNPELIERLKE